MDALWGMIEDILRPDYVCIQASMSIARESPKDSRKRRVSVNHYAKSVRQRQSSERKDRRDGQIDKRTRQGESYKIMKGMTTRSATGAGKDLDDQTRTTCRQEDV